MVCVWHEKSEKHHARVESNRNYKRKEIEITACGNAIEIRGIEMSRFSEKEKL